MRARKLRKRLEVWETGQVGDSFGGYTVSETKLGDSWADIRTLDRNIDVTQFGIQNTDLAVEITLRKRSDITYNGINQFFKYKGDKYNVISYPTDVNFDGSTIKVIAVKQQNKGG